MRIRQSDLKLWSTCPLQWKFANLDGMPRVQGGALTFGSILHHCVEYAETTGDVEGAVAQFHEYWRFPERLEPIIGQPLVVESYHRGASWVKYAEQGEEIIRNWASLNRWEADLVLAREYSFDLPIGEKGNRLAGTIDKLVISYHPADGYVVKVVDYKTNRKVPKYDFLEEDLQFSAYCWATTQEEFWRGLPGGRGLELFEQYKDLPRRGEWVHLLGPKRMDAGPRFQRHYWRIQTAVDNMADSVAMRIFVPNISGESCKYCDFRGPCGMPPIEEEDETPRY